MADHPAGADTAADTVSLSGGAAAGAVLWRDTRALGRQLRRTIFALSGRFVRGKTEICAERVTPFVPFPAPAQLYVKGEFVGGSDIVADLHEKGELAAMIGIKPAAAGAA